MTLVSKLTAFTLGQTYGGYLVLGDIGLQAHCFYTGTDIWRLSCVGDIGLQAHLLLHWDRHMEAILC